MSQKKILITGGAGFIGSHAAEQFLHDGWQVGVLDDFDNFYDPIIKEQNLENIKTSILTYRVNICNYADTTKVMNEGWDVVLHLAARAGVRPSINAPHLYVDTNVTGTLNTLEAARHAGVKKFLFASSSSVYGATAAAPFCETAALTRTLSPYAATKVAGEQLCSTYAHLHDMRVVVLRFFTVYGPRQRPDLAIHKFTRALFNEETIDQYGEGQTRRDYTYIDDIVQGVRAAADFERSVYEVFNLGGSYTIPLIELLNKLEVATGKKALVRRLPEQPGDMPATWADVRKAKELLGYSPRIRIDQGLEHFVSWYVENESHHIRQLP